MLDDSNEEWPPPRARLRSTLWRVEEHLRRSVFVAASRSLPETTSLVAAVEAVVESADAEGELE